METLFYLYQSAMLFGMFTLWSCASIAMIITTAWLVRVFWRL